MDIRTEADTPATVVDAGPDLVADPAVHVPGGQENGAGEAPTSQGPSLDKLIKLRDGLRRTLHGSLDDLLDSPAQNPDVAQGLGGVILDELMIDHLQGFGVNISVNTQHPNAPGRAVEDPSVTAKEAETKGRIHLLTD